MRPFAVSLLLIAATAAHAETEKIAVLDLAPATLADKQLAATISPLLAASVQTNQPGSSVISTREVSALLDAKAAQSLMGCDDERCLASHANALAADKLIGGQIGAVGDEVILFLALVRPKDGKVMARASHSFDLKMKRKDRELSTAAKRLFHPDAAKDSDELLAELRIAVVSDELDEDKDRPVRAAPVAGCLRDSLTERKARLVDPRQVARIRHKANWRDVVAGGLPEDAVTTADADLLLVSVVDYADASNAANKSMGNVKWSAAGNLQLIKVDTGEVIVSQAASLQQPEHSKRVAMLKVGKALCTKKFVPALTAKLGSHFARGNRIVLEVKGGLAKDGAPLVVEKLTASQNVVARTIVRRYDEDDATIDVTLHGGNGHKLALLLRSALPDMNISAEPSKVVLSERAAAETKPDKG
jgi:hypothetical protein